MARAGWWGRSQGENGGHSGDGRVGDTACSLRRSGDWALGRTELSPSADMRGKEGQRGLRGARGLLEVSRGHGHVRGLCFRGGGGTLRAQRLSGLRPEV